MSNLRNVNDTKLTIGSPLNSNARERKFRGKYANASIKRSHSGLK